MKPIAGNGHPGSIDGREPRGSQRLEMVGNSGDRGQDFVERPRPPSPDRAPESYQRRPGKKFEMTVIGLGAAILDIVFVASIVVLLRFTVSEGLGLSLDLLLILLTADGILLLLYGRRVHQFMSHRALDGLSVGHNHAAH